MIKINDKIYNDPFRIFFSLAAIYLPFLILIWVLFYGFGQFSFIFNGYLAKNFIKSIQLWHAHELIFGFIFAAIAGFLLTALPEFLKTEHFKKDKIKKLAIIWIIARISFLLAGILNTGGNILLLNAAAFNIIFLIYLLYMIAPLLIKDKFKKHNSFAFAIIILIISTAGLYYKIYSGADFMPWIYVNINIMMILIVLAMSRISMNIINKRLDKYCLENNIERFFYTAKIPKRNIAIFCLSILSLLQIIQVWHSVIGWICFAISAAILNIMGDWHIGRAFFNRWIIVLYAVYIFMALGFGLMGWGLISSGQNMEYPAEYKLGLHVISMGAMGLSVYLVFIIAGYTHSGLNKDDYKWVWIGILLVIIGVLFRALAFYIIPQIFIMLAGSSWIIAFLLLTYKMLPIWIWQD